MTLITPGNETSAVQCTSEKWALKDAIQTQVLQRQPVTKILNGEVFSVVIRDLQEPVTIYLGNRRKAEHGILERFAAAY